MPRRFLVVPWTTSGGLGAPAALPSGNIRLAFRKRSPMGRNHCHPALKNDSGLAHWCPRSSKSGSLRLQKPLGKRERTHAHSPVLGVQANLIAFNDACTHSAIALQRAKAFTYARTRERVTGKLPTSHSRASVKVAGIR